MYLVRLFKNALKILRSYGIRSFVAKTKWYVKQFSGPEEEKYDDNVAFRKWLKDHLADKNDPKRVEADLKSLKNSPKISIIMPVYNPDRKLFEKAIESVRGQYYINWELCMNDDASTKPWVKPYMKQLAEKDDRIKVGFSSKNAHIAVNSNKCAELASSDYFVLMDNDDMLPEYALLEYAMKLDEHPDADIIYGDEYKLDMEGTPCEPWFRTEYMPELELAMCPFVHCLISRDAFEKAGKFKKGTEGSQDYDLYMRIVELTDKIHHIPEMLYIWRKVAGSTADKPTGKNYAIEAAKRVIENAVERRGMRGEVTGDTYPFRFIPEVQGNPSVEIIIPTKDGYRLLRRALRSVQKRTLYKNYSITIIDHESTDPKIIKYLGRISQYPQISVLPYKGEFNFSRMNNIAVEKSSADIVVFMNNDIEITAKGWLKELVGWAQMPEIGPVGGLLRYPDTRVQHAGIILGLGGIANHAYWLEPDTTQHYFNHIRLVRNYSAVSGALMGVERSKFQEFGGFNENELAIGFQDVDLCLRMWERGYRTVYTPWIKAIHHESLTRKQNPQSQESSRIEEKYMLEHWGDVIKEDPFYSVHYERGVKEHAQRSYRIGEYRPRVERS